MNILLSNAGRRTYLIEYLLELQEKYKLSLFVADAVSESASLWVDKSIIRIKTPRVSDDPQTFVKVMLEVCAQFHINMIIPLMDFEIPLLADNKAKFAALGTSVVVSNADLVEALLDKHKTDDLCNRLEISYPKSWYTADADDIKFPLIKKRILGSGSVGFTIVENPEQLHGFESGQDLLQEKIEGQEYGLDILNDLEGNFLHACAKKKLLMRAGETDKAKVISDTKYLDLAHEISQKLKHIGNLDIDFIETPDGGITFIDFNPRFGGGYPFTHMAGCNYLKALLDLHLGSQVQIQKTPDEITGMKGLCVYGYDDKGRTLKNQGKA